MSLAADAGPLDAECEIAVARLVGECGRARENKQDRQDNFHFLSALNACAVLRRPGPS